MKRTVSRPGRGLVLRIPADAVKTLDLIEDSEVCIWIQDNRMMIEKVEK